MYPAVPTYSLYKTYQALTIIAPENVIYIIFILSKLTY